MESVSRLSRWLALLLFLLAPSWVLGGAFFGLIGDSRVNVSGFGVFANINLERALEILDNENEKREYFDGVYLEDAVWILAGEVKQQGYLKPAIDVTLLKGGKVIFESVWQGGDLDPNAPRDLQGDAVQFNIRSGVLYYFHSVTIMGLPDDLPDNPKSYFFATDQLWVSEQDRYFTESRWQAGLNRIINTLQDLGYREAIVGKRAFVLDDTTGQVTVAATIEPGPIYWTDSMIVRIHRPHGGANFPMDGMDAPSYAVRLLDQQQEEKLAAVKDIESERESDFLERRISPDWISQEIQSLRREFFARGYPEVNIEADFEVVDEDDQRVFGNLVIEVKPGAHASLHGVQFKGGEAVAPWLLEKQAAANIGEPLNRNEVEEGRTRLSKLGVFNRVQVDYEEVDPGQWDVIYDLTPKGKTELDAIFGVGSFDIIRVGLQVERNNLWSIAHRAKFRAIQSFKATYVDLDYFIPQVMGVDLDFFSQLNYLNRQELTFDRQEWGARAGFQHFIKALSVNASVTYSLDNVKASNRNFIVPPGPDKARIGSMGFKFVQSHLDSPIFPTDGYHWFIDTEFARPMFGGDVDYNSFEIGGAYHLPVGDIGLVLHLGFKHGVIITSGEAADEIPVNRRFFLGGENTVRGYQRDEASPVNLYGQQIGAVSYMLWQGELEQRINDTFSIVAFVDAVGNAAFIENYPFDEVLVSVGGGVSIRTIVGPLRVEYGYNVKKREIDPVGNVQVGLGFPF